MTIKQETSAKKAPVIKKDVVRKKTNSIFTEPYHLAILILESFTLLYQMFIGAMTAIYYGYQDSQTAENKALSNATRLKQEQIRYKNMMAKSKIDKQSWNRFIITGIIIQTVLCGFTVAHLLTSSYIVGLEFMILSVSSIIFLGYKPWILTHKEYPTFLRYLTQMWTRPRGIFLVQSFNLVET